MDNKEKLKIIVLLTIVVLICYGRIIEHEFLDWDDDHYILKNGYIRSLSFSHLKAMFSVRYLGNYHPLTLLSYAFDYQIAGLEPSQYLLSNLFLHLLNVLLVFSLIYLLSPQKTLALAVALLFAVHPMQVESVAWIAERKNVLYAFFFFLSLIMYIKYVKQTKPLFYASSVILFFLSLLSKATAVMLAPTLLLVDDYFGRNFKEKKIWYEKAPFFVLSIIFGIIAIWAQKTEGAMQYGGTYNFIERCVIASYAYWQYFFKIIFPINLSAVYPYPDILGNYLPATFWIYPFLVVGLILVIIKLYRRNRLAFFALLFYSFNIFLLLQLFPVGASMMADRYIYVPSIGIFLLIGLFYVWVTSGKRMKPFRPFLSSAIIIILMILTIFRCGVWKNSITFWNDVIDKHPNIFYAYNNRGSAYFLRGDYQAALADYDRTIQLMPKYPNPFYNKGLLKVALKDYQGAISEFDQAIALNSKIPSQYFERAKAKIELNDLHSAMADLDTVVQLDPRHAEVWMHRGVIKKRLGDFDGAISEYNHALQINPNDYAIVYNRGLSYFNRRDLENAVKDFQQAIRLNPSFADAYFSLGFVYQLTGNFPQALECYNLAIKNNPQFGKAYHYRGIVKMNLGQSDEGNQDLQKAISLGYVTSQ